MGPHPDTTAAEADARLGARIRRLSENIFVILAALGLITLLRNLLELLGPLTGSRNFCCFAPDLSSFLNTFTYELLILFGGIFLVHRLAGGDRRQLRRLVVLCVGFMLPLFMLVPLVNLLLNYHGPELPIWLLPGLYLPMGSVVGFVAILGLLPLFLRRLYPERRFLRVFGALLLGFLVVFAWTYIVGLWLAFGPSHRWLSERQINRMDLYSLTFIAPLVLSFPSFVRAFYPAGERRGGWLAYGLVLALTAFLVVSSNVISQRVRLAEPLICEQILIAHQGARDAPPAALPKEDARRLAQRIADQGRVRPADFLQLRRLLPPGPALPPPRRLVFIEVPTAPEPRFLAGEALRLGEVSAPLETPQGFLVLRRRPGDEPLRLMHILAAWQSPRHPGNPGAARLRALSIAGRLLLQPERFGEIARQESDGPFAPQDGVLPPWQRGLIPALDAEVLSLEPGGITGPLESPLGLHFFRRLPDR